MVAELNKVRGSSGSTDDGGEATRRAVVRISVRSDRNTRVWLTHFVDVALDDV